MRGFAGGAGQGGGFRMPASVGPGGPAGPGGGGGGPGAFGGGGNLDPEEQQAALAERMNSFAGAATTDMLIRLLEARAEGETFELGAPAGGAFGFRGFPNVRTMLALVSEETGLDQGEIMTQSGEGQTLAEIIEANGGDVEEVVAQAIAAETERVNQAVADGVLEQSEADEILANLETNIREMLEQPLQFGRQFGGADEQP